MPEQPPVNINKFMKDFVKENGREPNAKEMQSFVNKMMKEKTPEKKGMNKGGNFSSKELIMKATQPKKSKTFKEAFAEARAKLGPGKVFTFKGKKYTTDRADDKKKKSKSTKKKSTVKIISSKVKSDPLKKFTTPVKKPTKTKQGEQIKRMAQQKMTAEDNIGRQIAAAKGKSSMKLPTDTSSYQNVKLNKGGLPKLKKMNKGGVFKGIF